jgi:hypothetical protein
VSWRGVGKGWVAKEGWEERSLGIGGRVRGVDEQGVVDGGIFQR